MENVALDLFQIGLMLAIVVPLIFFVLTLQNTLKAVEPHNRTMQPGNVWFTLIPVFSFVWSFFVVTAIADSAGAQLEQYGLYTKKRPAYQLGTAWSVCLLLSVIVRLLAFISLILLILYWIKINSLRKQLLQLKEMHQPGEDGSVL